MVGVVSRCGFPIGISSSDDARGVFAASLLSILRPPFHPSTTNMAGTYVGLCPTHLTFDPLQSVEAILYLLQGVVSNVTQQGSTQVQTVLSLFPRLPPHPTLVKTALSLLGTVPIYVARTPLGHPNG